jgi:peptidoglycan/LPS O-acetylase OafA/YrhL
MIQRVQSVFFFFSAICSITIVYTFPVLQNETTTFLLKEHFTEARLFVFLSAAFSLFAIFQFKRRKVQQLIASIARLMITIAFFLIVFLHRNEEVLGVGVILLIVPFIALIAANFFIKKDEKLVKSADRIR